MTLSELLSNHDIKNYCKMLKIKLNDINYKDKIIIDKEGCYIINLDHSSPLDGFNGTHWVALYVKKNEALYYDSYGLDMPPIIIKKIKKHNSKFKIYHNANQYQTMKSIYCGWYSLLMLYMCTKNSKSTIRGILNKYRGIFYYNENRYKNDDILKQNIKQIFSTI
jgi:hypothetical protein